MLKNKMRDNTYKSESLAAFTALVGLGAATLLLLLQLTAPGTACNTGGRSRRGNLLAAAVNFIEGVGIRSTSAQFERCTLSYG